MIHKNPKISIIVNCLNGEKFVNRCLNNIFKQTYKNYEIIFWDNNSSDNSLNLAKRFNSKKLKIYKSQKTIKLYSARNNAVEKSSANYLAFLDIDDTWKKNKLKKQIISMHNNNVDMVYTNYYRVERNKKKIFNQIINKKDIISLILTKNPISISSILVKKKCLKKINYFNKKYEIIGDFDFYYKFCQKFKISYIHDPLTNYNVHGNNFSIRKEKLRISEINNWIRKNNKGKNAKIYNKEFQIVKDKNIYFEISNILKNKENKSVIKKILAIKSPYFIIKSLVKLIISFFYE